MNNNIIEYYDFIIDDGNDPVLDTPELKKYMDKWDGNTFINLLELNKNKSILEIGCGTGRLAVRVAPFVKSFCGIDISPKTIEIAKTHLPFLNTELICADFLTYKFDKTFDVIYSSLTFMHFENKEYAINKVSKLLNSGGRFVLSIDKNKNDIIDYGVRKIKIFPDDLDIVCNILSKNNVGLIDIVETEFAFLIVSEKNSRIDCD